MPEIAADQRGALAGSEADQAAIEGIDPAGAGPGRDSEGQEAKTRFAAHRRDIAESAGERLPSGVGSGVSGAAKVDVFEEEVGGEKQVVGSAARTENGTIVTDAEEDTGTM